MKIGIITLKNDLKKMFLHKNRLVTRNGKDCKKQQGYKYLSLLGAVMVINYCWEEGYVITLLCAPRMQQSVTESALQFCNCFMHGVVDVVHMQCCACWSESKIWFHLSRTHSSTCLQ
ncbi:hypothetical protein AMECASPLE_005929 [Ameca splendens]|uniref:Uncharacterized protein n=1 Tax=Ameca splendens TaxID=208324 RepID=A0ABV1A5I7_9TELE